MTVPELEQYLSGRAGVTMSTARAVVKALVGAIQAEVREGGEITLHGLGTFRAKRRDARTAEGFARDGDHVRVVHACRVVSFHASKAFRRIVRVH